MANTGFSRSSANDFGAGYSNQTYKLKHRSQWFVYRSSHLDWFRCTNGMWRIGLGENPIQIIFAKNRKSTHRYGRVRFYPGRMAITCPIINYICITPTFNR
jgi:hypothetical protein